MSSGYMPSFTCNTSPTWFLPKGHSQKGQHVFDSQLSPSRVAGTLSSRKALPSFCLTEAQGPHTVFSKHSGFPQVGVRATLYSVSRWPASAVTASAIADVAIALGLSPLGTGQALPYHAHSSSVRCLTGFSCCFNLELLSRLGLIPSGVWAKGQLRHSLSPFPAIWLKNLFPSFLQAWTVQFITVSGWRLGSTRALPREEVRGILPLSSFLVLEFIWHPAAQLHSQYPSQITLLVALEVSRFLEETLPTGLPEGPPIYRYGSVSEFLHQGNSPNMRELEKSFLFIDS